jgi:radical SAM protein with 4Fe4S-binding SPASM domain
MKDRVGNRTVPKPVSLRFETTTRCSLKCSHCHVAATRSGIDLDFAVFKKALNEGLRLGIKSVRFSGGEPALWPHLKDALMECADRGIQISINTTDPMLISQAQQMVGERNRIRITTTINAFPGSEHDRIVGVAGHFEALLTAIESNRETFRTDVNFPLLAQNLRCVFELHEMLSAYSVERLCLNRIYPAGRALANREEIPGHTELAALVEKVMRHAPAVLPTITFTNGIPLCLGGTPSEFQMYNNGPICKYGHENVAVSADGRMRICVALPSPSFDLRESTLEEVYYSQTASDWRSGAFLPAHCQKCQFFDLCRGGCRLAALDHSGRIDGEDPLCLVACKKEIRSWSRRNLDCTDSSEAQHNDT